MVTWEQMFTANTRTIQALTSRPRCGDVEKEKVHMRRIKIRLMDKVVKIFVKKGSKGRYSLKK